MLIKEAWINVGGLSSPSKMPCWGWSLSPLRCNTGSRLRPIPGTTCSNCYASKGQYVFPACKAAHEKRYRAWKSDPQLWVESMVTLLNSKQYGKSGYFRWFDSGDLQSPRMLLDILEVAERTPHISHWLPTREYSMVSKAKEIRAYYNPSWPSNLVIRFSTVKVNEIPKPLIYEKIWGNWSTVLDIESITSPELSKSILSALDNSEVVLCPALQRPRESPFYNKCGPCRDCWDKGVKCVAYQLH